jgi:hypothetical protein
MDQPLSEDESVSDIDDIADLDYIPIPSDSEEEDHVEFPISSDEEDEGSGCSGCGAAICAQHQNTSVTCDDCTQVDLQPVHEEADEDE